MLSRGVRRTDRAGSRAFRTRLVLSALSGRPLRLYSIREYGSAGSTSHSSLGEDLGLQAHEVSFLRLLERISNGTRVEINETGTALQFRPGVLVGGKLVHKCAATRGVAYYLEPLFFLLAFAKKASTEDPTPASLVASALPILKHCGIESINVSTSDDSVTLSIAPIVVMRAPKLLPSVPTLAPVISEDNLAKDYFVRRIRGLIISSRLPPSAAGAAIDGAKVILKPLATDKMGEPFFKVERLRGDDFEPGFAVVIVADMMLHPQLQAIQDTEVEIPPIVVEAHLDVNQLTDTRETPETAGRRAAALLLEELNTHGVVDSARQPIATMGLILSAEAGGIQSGPLTSNTIALLQESHSILGVTCDLRTNSHSGVDIRGMGAGIRNTARRAT